MNDPLVPLAFMTGLLGTGHCLGMCGGLVSALSLSPEGRRSGGAFPALYHLGRVSTYAMIGLVVGWLGSALVLTAAFRPAAFGLLLLSDLFVIVLGLGSAGVWPRFDLMRLESPSGTRLLGRLTARFRRFPPLFSPLLLGLLMGFLPCGLLYAVVLSAAQSAAPLTGAAVMAAFGLGTVPGLLLVGGLAQWMGKRGRLWMVRAAGVTVVLMGGWNLWRHLAMLTG